MYKINSFEQFITQTQKYRNNSYVFRGVSDSTYSLIPKVGRKKHFLDKERDIFHQFKRLAYRYIPYPEQKSELDFLSIAQHHGLPTRLLDWSSNPLVALYFSLIGEENITNDGAIYILDTSKLTNLSEYVSEVEDIDIAVYDCIQNIDKVFLLEHNCTNERLEAQDGLFTIHMQPNKRYNLVSFEEYEPSEWHETNEFGNEYIISDFNLPVNKIIIPSGIKSELKFNLQRVGINQQKLFPGLDGICDFLTNNC